MKQRPYPHDLPSERALLGGMLMDVDVCDRVVATGLTPGHFYRTDHGRLYELLVDRLARGEAIDLVAIPEVILRGEDEQRFGGVAYVMGLPDHCVSTANIEHYARVVMRGAQRRELLATLEQAHEDAYTADDPMEVADAVISGVSTNKVLGVDAGWAPMWQVLDDTHAGIVDAAEQPELRQGLSTSLRDLDGKIGGLFPTDLVVVAGRPGMGKTALAMQIVQSAAELGHGETHIGVFSLEMSDEQLARRQLGAISRVNGMRLRKGDLGRDELDNLDHAHQYLRQRVVGLWVDDTPSLTVEEIAARARRLVREVGHVAVFVVDYLQLVSESLGGRSSREREVAHISRQLKILAKDLGSTIMLLSQLNRSCEQRTDKRPQLSDLRESGAVEQDADVVLFCFRPEYYWPNDPVHKGKAEVIVGKNRHGALGTVDLKFDAPRTRFESLSFSEMSRGRG